MDINKIVDDIMKILEIIITAIALIASGYLFAKNIYPTLEFPGRQIEEEIFDEPVEMIEIYRNIPIEKQPVYDNTVKLKVNRLLEPEFELLCRTVYAEACNQGYEGKRLVAACILNRVDSDAFPDTITEVLYQERQFTTVTKGTIYKYELDEETIEACTAELSERSNSDIIYFCSTGYVNGTPWQKIGDHYFSTR